MMHVLFDLRMIGRPAISSRCSKSFSKCLLVLSQGPASEDSPGRQKEDVRSIELTGNSSDQVRRLKTIRCIKKPLLGMAKFSTGLYGRDETLRNLLVRTLRSAFGKG